MRKNSPNRLGISVLITLAFMTLICGFCIAMAWQYSGMILLGMPVQIAIFIILLPGAFCILIYRLCSQLDILPDFDGTGDKEA